MQGKRFFPIPLFEQGLANNFRLGPPKAFGFTAQPALERIIDLKCKRLHNRMVIPLWQKCNTKRVSIALISFPLSAAFLQANY